MTVASVQHRGQRLVPSHVGHQPWEVSRLDQLVGELLRGHVVSGRLPDEVVGQLRLAHLDLLGVGDRVEQELRLHGLSGRFAQLLGELVAGLSLPFEELLEQPHRRDRRSARSRVPESRLRPGSRSPEAESRPYRAAAPGPDPALGCPERRTSRAPAGSVDRPATHRRCRTRSPTRRIRRRARAAPSP